MNKKNLRYFYVNYLIISLIISLYTPNCCYSSDKNNYFKRESEYIDIGTRGLISVCRSKKRHGGPGPEGLIEISPWIPSFEYLKKIPIDTKFDFVFDCGNKSFYIRCPDVYGKKKFKEIGGHVQIAFHAKIARGCGGEFWKTSEEPLVFRSNEVSGHRGLFWKDARRFSYISLLCTLGISIYHEPYTLDEYKLIKPNIKAIVENFTPYDDNHAKCVEKMRIFSLLSLEDLRLFQRNFYRKFGNSIFNPAFYPYIYLSFYNQLHNRHQKNKLYGLKEGGCLELRDIYKGKGKLDQEFDFSDPIQLEEYLLKQFTDKH